MLVVFSKSLMSLCRVAFDYIRHGFMGRTHDHFCILLHHGQFIGHDESRLDAVPRDLKLHLLACSRFRSTRPLNASCCRVAPLMLVMLSMPDHVQVRCERLHDVVVLIQIFPCTSNLRNGIILPVLVMLFLPVLVMLFLPGLIILFLPVLVMLFPPVLVMLFITGLVMLFPPVLIMLFPPVLVMLFPPVVAMLQVVAAAAAIGGGPFIAPVIPGSLLVAANLVQVSAALPVVAAAAAGIWVLQ